MVLRQVVPILRAGLVLLEQATTVLPASETYHVGYVRDESTLKAREYLNKLPASLDAEDRILITDPMLATGARPCHGFRFRFRYGTGGCGGPHPHHRPHAGHRRTPVP